MGSVAHGYWPAHLAALQTPQQRTQVIQRRYAGQGNQQQGQGDGGDIAQAVEAEGPGQLGLEGVKHDVCWAVVVFENSTPRIFLAYRLMGEGLELVVGSAIGARGTTDGLKFTGAVPKFT